MIDDHDLDVSRTEMIDPRMAVIFRAKSGMERLRIAHEAWEVAHSRLSAYLASLHPEWNTEQLRAAVAKRLSREPG